MKKVIHLIMLMLGLCGSALAQERVFPEPPLLVSPPNGGTIPFPGIENQPVSFDWEPVQEADSYQISVIRIAPSFRPLANADTADTSASLSLNLTLNDVTSTVKWTVVALQGNQPGQISEAIFTFTAGTNPTPTPVRPPAVPQLIAPPDQAQFTLADAVSGFGIQFQWQDVTGAAGYRFTIYDDNEPYVVRTIPGTEETTFQQFFDSVQNVYQWDVQAVNAQGVVGNPGNRWTFTVGTELPTPTPFPTTADLDRQGNLNAADVFHFATRFRTNALDTDYNHSGITDEEDLLIFIEQHLEE